MKLSVGPPIELVGRKDFERWCAFLFGGTGCWRGGPLMS